MNLQKRYCGLSKCWHSLIAEPVKLDLLLQPLENESSEMEICFCVWVHLCPPGFQVEKSWSFFFYYPGWSEEFNKTLENYEPPDQAKCDKHENQKSLNMNYWHWKETDIIKLKESSEEGSCHSGV